jgi:NAD(P)-dependent dehydrogenase (short-subunit alcohol dehydrogenase family)
MTASSRVALVTGAGTGLGAYLAERLARAGYRLALHYRSSRSGALRVQKRIHQVGGDALLFSGDLAKEDPAQKLIAGVRRDFGRLDVLINNAGVYHPKNLAKLTEKEWLEGLHSTASTTFFTTRAALPLLRRSRSGRIINLGDSSCDRPTARDLAMSYHIGKTGVLMLTKSFARAEAAHGLTVNLISPGLLTNTIKTPETKKIPAGRMGTFDDIGNAVEFLLKPESNYLNGSNLIVSGGWNLR